jgi:internalin A
VLVLTGRENSEKTDAEYWLRLIRAFGSAVVFRTFTPFSASHTTVTEDVSTSPVLVVLNKCRSSPSHIDKNALQEKYPFIVDFIETDCKTGTGVRELKSEIVRTIEGMDSVRRPFPAAWFGIKNALANPASDYITFDEFRELCRRHREPDPEKQNALATALHDLGVALNYADDARLKDKTVLNPQWVTNGIYTLLRKASHLQHPAEMWLADVEQALPAEKPEMRRFLVELMRRFELVFPLVEPDRWLVPQRLPESQPKLGAEWQGKDVTRVRFTYMALPEGLVPRFITRTYPLSEDQPRWVNGVVLENDGARALVKADREERTILVSVIGNPAARPGLMALACEELQKIHNDIKGLGEKQEMELKDNPGVWVLVSTLKQDEKARQPSATDSGGRGTIHIETTTELNRISAPAARDPKARKPKVFVSYSKHDVRHCDALLMRLKCLRADGLVEPWNDRDIRPGEEWDDEIKRQLNAADVIVFLVSPAFEATDYIRDTEIPLACARADKGECKVVPVILEKANWPKGIVAERLGKYNALPAKGKPVRDFHRHNDAWHEVQQKLRAECEELVKKLRDRESSDPRRCLEAADE